jgi:hypothetical protein
LSRRQRLPDITLSGQSSISFAIPSIGNRDAFVDDSLIPSIFKQGIKTFEIVIAGRYQGKYLQNTEVQYVPVRKFPVYFYIPLGKGVSKCRYEWIVAMGDDMVLADNWYSNLIAAVAKAGAADIYGFRILNPDGSLYAEVLDAFGLRQADHRIRPTSYFPSYVAKKAMFEVLPYPAYMSCDRHHALLMSERGFKKKFLPSVCVTHSGAIGQPGAIPRASQERYDYNTELRTRLGLMWDNAAFRRRADYRKKALKWFQYASKLEKKTKKLGIWGCFGHGRVADDLILNGMAEAFSGHEISVYTDRPGGLENNRNISRVSHTGELREQLGELDLLLVGGGDVLRNEIITAAFPRELMLTCQTPVIVYAAGVPSFDWCNDLYYFLSRCYLITVRDNLCLNFIKQRFGDIPSLLLPDPVFLTEKLKGTRVPGKVVLNLGVIPEGLRQGLPPNINDILSEQLNLVYRHLVGKNYSPLVLGFDSNDESMLSHQGHQYKIVDPGGAVEEIATAELLIGGTYHSGVIAVTQHTPAILLNYRNEMEGLKTLISSGIKVVGIDSLDLITEFEAFRQGKFEYKPREIETVKETIIELNDMYVNYVY